MTLLNGSLQADGSFAGRKNVRTITGTAVVTVLPSDQILRISAAGQAVVVTFVPTAGNSGQEVKIEKTDVTMGTISITDGTTPNLAVLATPAQGIGNSTCQSIDVLSSAGALSFS